MPASRRPRQAEPAQRRAAEPTSRRRGCDYGSGPAGGDRAAGGHRLGGLLIGWAWTRWLGTRPLFLIVFFLLGAAAGMLNAYRHLRRMQAGEDP